MASIAAPQRASFRHALSTRAGRMPFPVLTGGLLGCFHVLLFCVWAPHLGLVSDDWWELRHALTTPMSGLLRTWRADYRPLEMLPWLLWGHLFGTWIAAYYFCAFGLAWLAAVLVCLLATRLTGDRRLGLGAGLLWSVYPADGTRGWLTMGTYRTGALFFALAALLVLEDGRRPRLRYGAALLSACCALGGNELYLGLVALLPIATVLRARCRRQGYAVPCRS
jgi:hypothetical protein